MTFVWTAERDKELREHFGCKGSAGELASKWGVSRNVICGRKHRLGIRGGKYSHDDDMTEDDIATLVAMRRSGKKVTEIAKALNRNAPSLYAKLSALGIVRSAWREAGAS